MGCDKYTVSGMTEGGWDDGTICFSEGDDSVGCLCTFPFNYGDHKLDLETVRSLAYLGAAVALQHHERKEWRYLPGDLPEWMREEIDRCILTRQS